MKKIIFSAVLALSIFAFSHTNAQARVSVNIGLQPVWGPVGYDHVDYYYIPDIDAYYDVPGHVFVYIDNGRWIHTRALPPRYANFDLYHSYKVVLNERRPWIHHETLRAKYEPYRNHHDQIVIRESHEPKYYQIKEHPQHNEWHGNDHHGGHHDNNEHHDNGHH